MTDKELTRELANVLNRQIEAEDAIDAIEYTKKHLNGGPGIYSVRATKDPNTTPEISGVLTLDQKKRLLEVHEELLNEVVKECIQTRKRLEKTN